MPLHYHKIKENREKRKLRKLFGETSIKEKVLILRKMLQDEEIDESDLFAIICVLRYGFYCEIGVEEKILSSVNKLDCLEMFKKWNRSIHDTPLEDIISELTR